jgi:peptide/nickel transport system substrate-binding protein
LFSVDESSNSWEEEMKKVYRLWLLLIIVAFIVAACGADEEEPTEEPAVEEEVVEEPTEEPTEEPVAEDTRGILRFDAGLEYGGNENLDPVDANRFWPAISLLYDRLTEPAFDELRPVPSLAESWESNDAGDVWTFHLRDDVFFHDGTQLTSADVAYSANHWKTSETSILNSTFAVVDSIDTPDDFTIVFNLGQTVVDFPLLVMDYRARVLPEDGLPDVLTTGMGSGPFKLETLDIGGTNVLVANDDYWDGPPGVKQIELFMIADTEASIQALLAGQHDWSDDALFEQSILFEGNDDYMVTQLSGGNWSGMVMRTDIPPFDNLALRQAMHHVVDRQAMVDLALSGAGTVSCDTNVMPGDPYKFEADCPQDLDLAREKLVEAGYADGIDVTLNISDICPDWTAMAEIMQQDAAEVGINIEIQQLPSDGFWSDAWMVEPFVATCWNERTADQALNELYRSGGEWNESFWNVPEFDALLDAARAESDFNTRRDYYLAAQKMLHEEGGTIIPYFNNVFRVQKSCIDGIPPIGEFFFDWTTITKDETCN